MNRREYYGDPMDPRNKRKQRYFDPRRQEEKGIGKNY